MNLRHLVASLLLFSFAVASSAQQQPTPAPPQVAAGGGVPAAAPNYRVFRSISGSKGAVRAGRYIVEDPRTIFYIPEDKQVIVYFEWDGPLGTHRFEGLWKNPEGKVSVISEFTYEAKEKRYAGYWTLVLSDVVPTGIWTLEARIDGESAGTHNFQVLAAPKPPGTEPPPPKLPLEPAAVYRKAIASSVTIERLNASGEKMGTGSGFFLGDSILLTAFQVIDGASSLRIWLPDGTKVQAQEVLNWNRRQDWALLQASAGSAPKLVRAASKTWAVGDRCYSLGESTPGNWTLATMDIIGANQYPGAGDRVNVSGGGSPGAPLLDEFGEVIGVVGGSLLPGTQSLGGVRFGFSAGALLGGVTRGALATPIEMVTLSAGRRATLAALLQTGESTPPLTAHEHIISGTLSRDVERGRGLPQPVDEKYEYYARDQQCVILLGLSPKEKRDVMATLRIFDVDNRPVATSKPSKLKLRKNDFSLVDWKLPLTTLKPGLYRVDVYFDDEPAWRTFFRILE